MRGLEHVRRMEIRIVARDKIVIFHLKSRSVRNQNVPDDLSRVVLR